MVKFWVVINQSRIGTCKNLVSKIHTTEHDAIVEAKRLCQKEGYEFIVMEATKSVFPKEQPVQVEEIN